MYVVIWEFFCKPDHIDKLIQANGINGDWCRVFASSPEYIGTEVLCDSQNRAHVVTIDRWKSKAAYENFLDQAQKEYEKIDRDLANLTETENCIGCFKTC
jgi:hypothetical protein